MIHTRRHLGQGGQAVLLFLLHLHEGSSSTTGCERGHTSGDVVDDGGGGARGGGGRRELFLDVDHA